MFAKKILSLQAKLLLLYECNAYGSVSSYYEKGAIPLWYSQIMAVIFKREK